MRLGSRDEIHTCAQAWNVITKMTVALPLPLRASLEIFFPGDVGFADRKCVQQRRIMSSAKLCSSIREREGECDAPTCGSATQLAGGIKIKQNFTVLCLRWPYPQPVPSSERKMIVAHWHQRAALKAQLTEASARRVILMSKMV
jgi:hypothetical protein